MTPIWHLPKEIVSRIAAGEVVERPLNIVKELVENSIDAHSTKIMIQITNGGLEGIIVDDNGDGINQSEVELAFQLHTTSKLTDDQIANVRTLGFRGEALASITAVSLVECSTVQENTQTKLVLEAGKVTQKSINKTNMPSGTKISVSSLFFNTPVRKKFLKKPATERKKIIELISHFCLSYPNIHFILEEMTSSGKNQQRLESPSRQGILAVIFDVLGHEVANSLIPVKGKLSNWEVEGYISKPNLTKSDRSTQYICVNGRVIRHGELQSKIESAYGSQLMRSSYPVIILNLIGSNDLVDFNIHPQKTEIRFQDEDPLLEELSELVQKSLTEESSLQYLPEKKKPNKTNLVQNINLAKTTSSVKSIAPSTIKTRKFQQTSLVENVPKKIESGIKIMGHIMNKFAVVDGLDEELWLVDVHAADERVKFEYYTESSHRKVLSQQTLEPLSIELLASEKTIMLDNSNYFGKFGLKISDNGSNGILIHSIPVYFDQILTTESIRKLLDDIISYLSDSKDESTLTDSPFNQIENGIVARLACHGSIRSGYAVSNDVISKVIENLLKCKNPWTCAHGRPTVLKISKSTLESWFKR